MQDKVRRLTCTAALTGICLAFSFIEAILPPLPLPGVKLGLANIVIVYAAFHYGMRTAVPVSVVRIFLSFLLFGGGTSLFFSLSGGLAVLCMLAFLVHIPPFCSYSGISVLCATAHTAGQLCCAFFLTRTNAVLFTYGPILLISSAVCGFLTGILLNRIELRLQCAYRYAGRD